MTLIEWREDFRTGIAGVDFEHEQLIKDINAVYGLIGDDPGRQQVVDCLNEIYGDISAHFALEEQYMAENGYDRYLEHRTDHERLLDDIRAITDDFEASAALDRDGLRAKLSDWFGNHFRTHDARLHRLEELMAARSNEGVLQGFLRRLRTAVRRR